MAGIELATAYVDIVPSLRGAESKIGDALAGVDTSKAGEKIGASLGKSIASRAASALSSLGKTGARVLGGISTAIGGIAAAGGVSRALNIEQANKMFKSLGMDAEKAMASANEAVKGTQFGLDQAAKAAAQLGASGVAMGDDMTQSLKSIAGLASMAGVEYDRVSAIFGKVAATGKLQGDELNQFSEMGINALAALSDHLGVSQAEVRQMVTDGEVDFQTFADAMYETFGDAAQGANETFTGAISNMRAALSRLGADFAAPALDGLRKIVVALIPVIDQFHEALQPVIDAFSGVLGDAVGGVVDKLTAFSDWFSGQSQTVQTGIAGTVSALMGLAAASQVVLPALSGISEMFGLAGSSAQKAAPQLATAAAEATAASAATTAASAAAGSASSAAASAAAATTAASGKVSKFGAAVTGVLSRLGPLGIGAIAAGAGIVALGGYMAASGTSAEELAEKVTAAMTGFAEKLPSMVDVLTQNMSAIAQSMSEAIPQIVQGLTGALQQVVSVLPQVLPQVMTAVTTLVQSVASMLPTLLPVIVQAVVALVTSLASMLATVLPVLVQAVTTIITSLCQMLPTLLPMLVQAALQLFMALVQALPQVLTALVEGLTTLIDSVCQMLPTLIPLLIQAAITLFMALVQALPQILGALLSAATQVIGSVVSMLPQLIPALLSAAVQLFMALVKAVPKILSSLIGAVGDLLGRAKDAVIDFVPKMLDAGKNLVQGLIDGITGMVSSAVDAIGDFAGSIVDKAKSLFGIASPSKVFREFGGYLVEGMAIGIDKTAGKAVGSVEDMASGMLGALPSEMGAEIGLGGVAALEAAYAPPASRAVSAPLGDSVSYTASASGVSSGNTYNVIIDGDALDASPQVMEALQAFVDALTRQYDMGVRANG